jgi:hypothetical protein
MHEMSICENILDVLKEQARAQKFDTVKRVSLEIGPLSGVEIEALKFGFDVVMRDSIADGASARYHRDGSEGLVLFLRRVDRHRRALRSVSAMRVAPVAGDGRRGIADQGTGGELMCTVCGCGEDEVRIEGADKAHGDHHHGHA